MHHWAMRLDLVGDLRRGALAVHVLHQACEGDVTGVQLMDRLAGHGYPLLGPGTIYPLLHRLEEAGFLSSRPVVTYGRRHRRYEATTAGREAYRQCQRAVWYLAHERCTGVGPTPQIVGKRREAG
jgi:PadR family transcriptional regulator